MKKSIFINAAIIALAMLASCQKEQFTENVTSGVTEFTATIEQPTKTAINAADGKITWKAGDEITVTDDDSKSAVYVAGSDGASTTFTLKDGQTAVGTGPYIATYGDIANQVYDAAGANCPLTAAETSTTTFKFSSPYAVVKITAESDGKEVIKSVDVNYGENVYALNCGDGVTLTSDGIDFFVSVEPATEAAALSVTFHTTDDKTATKTRTEAVRLDAKDLLPVTLTFAQGDWESPEDDTPEPLKGVFTVSDSGTPDNPSDDVKVSFSQGNLRYVVKTKKWGFYEHQYDFCNTVTYTGHHSDTVSLFTWGYNAEQSILPDGAANNNVNRTSGDLEQTEDWGSQIGDGNTWRTLSAAEWMYLSSTRGASTVSGTSNARYATATVNGIAGIILLPDIYEHPSEVAALSKINTPSAAFTDNTYDLTAWKAMESAGAVFLPAAGLRGTESIINNYGTWGYYWSSSAEDGDFAYRGVNFGSNNYVYFGTASQHSTRGSGLSVRLVTVVSAPEPTEPEEPEKIEITKGTIGEHAYIGIGKVKWATQNLAISESGNMNWKGARTGENPEAVKVPGTDEDVVIVGDYFQWAAHAGYCGSDKGLLIYNSFTHDCCVGGDTKREFSFKETTWSHTYWFDSAEDPNERCIAISPYYTKATGYKKYNNSPADSYADNKTVLDSDDDVANILWGNTWRMPKNEEFQSLYNVTYWAWDATDMGYYVFLPADADQSKGGASGEIGSLEKSKALLFFPCSGSGSRQTFTDNGYYWSRNLNGTLNADVMILSGASVQFSDIRRFYGCSVRPVSD